MKNTLKLFGAMQSIAIIALVAVIGFSMVACPTSTSSGGGSVADTWTDVTSLSQLNGTWKGSTTQTQTQDGITAKLVMSMNITIDGSAETMSGSRTYTVTYSGSGIDSVWPSIKDSLSDSWTYNDSTHTVTATEDHPTPFPITLSFFGKPQINQNGTKFRATSDEGLEMILTKQ